MIIRYFLIFLMPISLFAELEINSVLHSDTKDYNVVKKIGQGSFGSIFEIIDSQGYHYAVKSYFESVFYKEGERSYHLRERLNHPNILRSTDLARQDGNVLSYCIFEFIHGITLEEVSNLTPAETIHICHQWIDALRFAFSHQLMHIDLNESNIMLSKSNHVTIIDIDSFFPIENVNYYSPSTYFDKIITEMCLTLVQKTTFERIQKIQLQCEIKKLAWEYREDIKEGKKDIFDEYMTLLLDRLDTSLSDKFMSQEIGITHEHSGVSNVKIHWGHIGVRPDIRTLENWSVNPLS